MWKDSARFLQAGTHAVHSINLPIHSRFGSAVPAGCHSNADCICLEIELNGRVADRCSVSDT